MWIDALGLKNRGGAGKSAGILLILLFAFALRAPSLFQHTFFPDEALFSSWGRLIAHWHDPWLTQVLVDKPPLLFYLQAPFFQFFRASYATFPARLPNFFASVLLVALIFRIYKSFHHSTRFAAVAALLLALSPLAIQFSATAFTDPLLTFFLIGTLFWVGYRGEEGGRNAGIFFGLALLTKYQALLFLPLFLTLAIQKKWSLSRFQNMISGVLPFLGFFFVWGWFRATPIWSQQATNFGGLGVEERSLILNRLFEWIELLGYSFSLAIWVFFGSLFLLITLMLLTRFEWNIDLLRTAAIFRTPSSALTAFCFGYFLIHWLLPIPVWERYLLPLMPLLALLAARLAHAGSNMIRERSNFSTFGGAAFVIAMSVLFLGMPAYLNARNSKLPIGGQIDADLGTSQLIDSIRDEPYGTVLYDRWASWNWRYHLVGTKIFQVWIPNVDALVEDLNEFSDEPESRFLVLVNDSRGDAIRAGLFVSGYCLEIIKVAKMPAGALGSTLYRIKHCG